MGDSIASSIDPRSVDGSVEGAEGLGSTDEFGTCATVDADGSATGIGSGALVGAGSGSGAGEPVVPATDDAAASGDVTPSGDVVPLSGEGAASGAVSGGVIGCGSGDVLVARSDSGDGIDSAKVFGSGAGVGEDAGVDSDEVGDSVAGAGIGPIAGIGSGTGIGSGIGVEAATAVGSGMGGASAESLADDPVSALTDGELKAADGVDATAFTRCEASVSRISWMGKPRRMVPREIFPEISSRRVTAPCGTRSTSQASKRKASGRSGWPAAISK
jgi:hypothetical protein